MSWLNEKFKIEFAFFKLTFKANYCCCHSHKLTQCPWQLLSCLVRSTVQRLCSRLSNKETCNKDKYILHLRQILSAFSTNITSNFDKYIEFIDSCCHFSPQQQFGNFAQDYSPLTRQPVNVIRTNTFSILDKNIQHFSNLDKSLYMIDGDIP